MYVNDQAKVSLLTTTLTFGLTSYKIPELSFLSSRWDNSPLLLKWRILSDGTANLSDEVNVVSSVCEVFVVRVRQMIRRVEL